MVEGLRRKIIDELDDMMDDKSHSSSLFIHNPAHQRDYNDERDVGLSSTKEQPSFEHRSGFQYLQKEASTGQRNNSTGHGKGTMFKDNGFSEVSDFRNRCESRTAHSH